MFHESQSVFQTLFESVSEGVIVVDTSQKIVATNQSANVMFGYITGELIGSALSVLIPQEYHSSHRAHVEDFLDKDEKRRMGVGRDIFGLHKNGSKFPVEAGLNPFNFDGEHYVMAIVIDITLRKEQEEKILELNVHLEEKVQQRTQALSASVSQLKELNHALEEENIKRIKAENKTKAALKKEKELNELKTRFLSLVSHEFKTPLSGILTSTMLLAKYKLTEQQEKRDKHLKTITNKVHYLNNILNDFLSIEKFETGNIQYKCSDFLISKVVNEVVYNANMLLKEGQVINYPEDIEDLTLYQDEKIIELALSNLINNAIKYSGENQSIDIVIKQDKSITSFTIIDHGIGIPESEQKNIFNRYFRAENALNVQGTGIGLNIVKSHIENLGGTIAFESVEEIGSTFTFTVPNEFKNLN
ncbi:PAS domain S-box protein [Paucihalobacter ruber]|uniref:histidine kinase n=1 Tax=Paucihalobacter ruber TaxID=2567861 RepID=A0A506PIP8_9FLAO|nr:PAS domain-containing sensor histidine kinase [Paucihalobacter ruber]TPV33489.1 PAS domain S-box protein [Paucihalobacter ruber]